MTAATHINITNKKLKCILCFIFVYCYICLWQKKNARGSAELRGKNHSCPLLKKRSRMKGII